MSNNFPKWCISLQILSSIFWCKFDANLNKNTKVQMHENLHKNVNEMFIQIFTSFWAIKAANILQFYTSKN